MKRAAVIGCGALGTILVTNFARAEGWTLTGVMARTKAHAEALAANAGCRAATTLEELLADKPDLVVEIAGIGAAKAYGEAVLEAGCDFVLVSAGALADADWVSDRYVLGDLQSTWAEFAARCLDFRHYLATDLIGTKKRLLEAQIAKNKRYYAQLEAQGKLLDEDLAMGQRTLERDSLLFTQSVISAADYETSVQNYIAKQNSKAGFDATLTSTQLSILQTEQQLVELAVQRENEVAEYERSIGQLRQQLLAAIAQWKEQYAFVAPMDGIVSLQGYWSKGQHVTVGAVLASIVPEKETEVIGRMEVPSAGFGKVETGQTVNVKLNGFPYMEYGVLKGTIRSISSVPASVQTATGTTIAYTVEVVFPEGMRTTYEKELPMIQQMDGTGEIITEDMRLIEQFIQPIVSLFKNR